MAGKTQSGFVEVGLYACSHCQTVRAYQSADRRAVELYCHSTMCAGSLTYHAPIAIDFERRQFIVPAKRER